MIETVQYAVMSETAVVIALVQRLGPSTGGATQGAQGDIWLAESCTSGGYTIPVFSPSTAAECHDLTVQAFNWAERLRTPVVLLTDKEVGMTTEVVDDAELAAPPLVERAAYQGGESFRTYGFATLEDVPAFAAVGGDTKVSVTGSAHDQQGRLRKNAPEVIEVLQHLERKIQAHAAEMELVRADLEPGAPHLLISYGITARAARQAVTMLRQEEIRVSLFQPQTLFPIPRRALARALDGVQVVHVAEENLTGQYRAMLAPYLSGHRVTGINRIGAMITPSEIAQAVRAA
jgi:2-oxoglutarate ferredoxin oxidoreductase subunit alpha